MRVVEGLDRERERQLADLVAEVTDPGRQWQRDNLEEVIQGEEAEAQSLSALLSDPNLIALGVAEKESDRHGTGEPAFTVYVRRKLPADAVAPWALVPRSIVLPNGALAPTDVVEVGEIYLQSNTVEAGVSVQTKGGPGTIAGLVERDDGLFLLTNRHVLAPSGVVGNGPVHAPAGNGLIGRVVRVANLQAGREFVNDVDAGLASIDDDRRGDLSTAAPYGQPESSIEPFIGMKVAKLGAQSAITTSEVLDAHFYPRIDYAGVGLVSFRDQIRSRKFTYGGDSGSMVWDQASKRPIGLHFAAMSDGSRYEGSIANRIEPVLSALKIRLVSGS